MECLRGCAHRDDVAWINFRQPPAAFAEALLAELERSGASGWRGERLVALTPYTPPPPGWLAGPARPQDWPRTALNL